MIPQHHKLIFNGGVKHTPITMRMIPHQCLALLYLQSYSIIFAKGSLFLNPSNTRRGGRAILISQQRQQRRETRTVVMRTSTYFNILNRKNKNHVSVSIGKKRSTTTILFDTIPRGGAQIIENDNANNATSTATALTNDGACAAVSYQFGSESLQDIMTHLNVQSSSTIDDHIANGLSEEEAETRLKQYGTNELVSPPGKTIFKLIAEQFEDRLVQILLCVAALSGVFSYFEMGKNSDEGLLKSFVEPLIILAILGMYVCIMHV